MALWTKTLQSNFHVVWKIDCVDIAIAPWFFFFMWPRIELLHKCYVLLYILVQYCQDNHFCLICLMKIVPIKDNSKTVAHLWATQRCFVTEGFVFLNYSFESMIQWSIHKDRHLLHSWMNQPSERIVWMNASMTHSVSLSFRWVTLHFSDVFLKAVRGDGEDRERTLFVFFFFQNHKVLLLFWVYANKSRHLTVSIDV